MSHTYLDFAATTPLDARVMDAMRPYLDQTFGNPSSLHLFGQQAERGLENSRRSLAARINAKPGEITFTASGSESDNLALRGAALAARERGAGNHLLVSAIEHPAVLETARQLASLFGFQIGLLPVDREGRVSPETVRSSLRNDTVLVSVMAANNEVGTLNPVQEIGKICREQGVPFHTDAVQYAAHLPLDVEELNVDLVSLGAHKFYGPKGVGALYHRSGLDLVPMLTGGSQESGLRASTQNVPLIVGFSAAYDLVCEERTLREQRLRPLRDRIIEYVLENIPDSQLTGSRQHRLPNHASFVFQGADGNLLLQVLDTAGFACSSGSACKTGDPKPSSVLASMGFEPDWALGSLRVTLGKDTSEAEIQRFLEVLPESVAKVRGITK